MKLVIILILVSISVKLVISEFKMPHDDEIRRQWNSFKSTHNIKFGRVDDRKKFLNFKKNYVRVAHHNYDYSQNETDFLTEINEFSYLNDQEYASIRLSTFTDLETVLARNKNQTTTQFDLSGESVVYDNETISRPISQHLGQAYSVDWLAQGKVTSVKNQFTCGSCWSFAAAGVIESLYAIKFGIHRDFSEQHLIDCDSNKRGISTGLMNYGCSGGWPEAAFDYIKYYGIVEDANYPYRNGQGSCQNSRLTNLPKVKISGFRNIAYGDELGLARAVAQSGPVAIGVDASEWSFAQYRSGIYSSRVCNANNVNHAVIVVGYGSENGKDYWLIKNSWGASWGQGGFMKLARNKGNMCGVATVASYAY